MIEILDTLPKCVRDVSGMDFEAASGILDVELDDLEKKLGTKVSKDVLAVSRLDTLLTNIAKTILRYQSKNPEDSVQVTSVKEELYGALSKYNT